MGAIVVVVVVVVVVGAIGYNAKCVNL